MPMRSAAYLKGLKELARTPVWTLDQAHVIIAELWPLMWDLHYHILLGGGVIREGKSDKDLDLFFIPLNGYESHAHTVLEKLWSQLGPSKALRDSPDYHADSNFHFTEAQKFDYLGKRIDVFIQ